MDRSTFKLDNRSRILEKSFLTSGSPPVSRILFTPRLTNIFAIE